MSAAQTLQVVEDYETAERAYLAEMADAKRRHRDDASPRDWNTVERPRLQAMHDRVMELRAKAAARPGACSCKGCIYEGAPVKPTEADGETCWVSLGVAILPGIVPRDMLGREIEVAPLAGLRMCGYCLRAYAKSKRRGAWLKRRIGAAAVA